MPKPKPARGLKRRFLDGAGFQDFEPGRFSKHAPTHASIKAKFCNAFFCFVRAVFFLSSFNERYVIQ